ncbi:MAG TPA: signal peptidase I [Alphaproteobacteria bacterium]|nr:signal peptidase I [Alphaproteobacteria bacterium]
MTTEPSKIYTDIDEAEEKKRAADGGGEDKKEKDDFFELVKAMVLAAAIALVIRAFLFEPFNIPSASMYPALRIGDYLFVEKYSYGYSRYSFPFGVASFKGRMGEGRPERGDIAVFRQPKKPDIDYIKRIVGLPGDTLQVIEGRLYINSILVPREFIGTESVTDQDGTRIYQKYVETLPNGIKHNIYEVSDTDQYDDTPVYTVPEGYYFAMGDNRDMSMDSRDQMQVGFVPEDNLVGRAGFLFFSTEGIGDKCVKEGALAAMKSVLCQVVERPKAVRYSRIFSRVQKL